MVRDSLDEPFRRVRWDETVVERVIDLRLRADALCMLGQMQTEDYYVMKLLKGCLGTNFDSNSRLCMSSAVAGYVQSWCRWSPCCYEDWS